MHAPRRLPAFVTIALFVGIALSTPVLAHDGSSSDPNDTESYTAAGTADCDLAELTASSIEPPCETPLIPCRDSPCSVPSCDEIMADILDPFDQDNAASKCTVPGRPPIPCVDTECNVPTCDEVIGPILRQIEMSATSLGQAGGIPGLDCDLPPVPCVDTTCHIPTCSEIQDSIRVLDQAASASIPPLDCDVPACEDLVKNQLQAIVCDGDLPSCDDLLSGDAERYMCDGDRPECEDFVKDHLHAVVCDGQVPPCESVTPPLGQGPICRGEVPPLACVDAECPVAPPCDPGVVASCLPPIGYCTDEEVSSLCIRDPTSGEFGFGCERDCARELDDCEANVHGIGHFFVELYRKGVYTGHVNRLEACEGDRDGRIVDVDDAATDAEVIPGASSLQLQLTQALAAYRAPCGQGPPGIDTDADGEPDWVDEDIDCDGLSNLVESLGKSAVERYVESSEVREDTDGDGILDIIDIAPNDGTLGADGHPVVELALTYEQLNLYGSFDCCGSNPPDPYVTDVRVALYDDAQPIEAPSPPGLSKSDHIDDVENGRLPAPATTSAFVDQDLLSYMDGDGEPSVFLRTTIMEHDRPWSADDTIFKGFELDALLFWTAYGAGRTAFSGPLDAGDEKSVELAVRFSGPGMDSCAIKAGTLFWSGGMITPTHLRLCRPELGAA